MDEKLNWLILAEKFISSGDAQSLCGVAEEIFELEKNSAEGFSILAESALYMKNFDDAENFAEKSLSAEKNNLRAKLVSGGVAAEKFLLKDELKIFSEVIDDAKKILETLTDEKKIFLTKKILFRALCWSSNGFYLAGDPISAAKNLLEASGLADEKFLAAELYSKHLFLKNYREISPRDSKIFAEKFNDFFDEIETFSHNKKTSPHKKIKVGYISPDFREHAAANFLMPFVKYFDEKNFSVTCYHLGKKDFVTEKFKKNKISWRDLRGKNFQQAAKIIYKDNLDILVDFSGHSQNNSLPILAFKPAPIQISAIGYTATTGLKTVDYFFSDKNYDGFTEKILPLENFLCYFPIHDMPDVEIIPPVMKNNFVTFGSFNNFSKVTDEILAAWKKILSEVENSRLVIKSKICSVEQGREILFERLQKINFPTEKIILSPYSKNYLDEYKKIDIALDTFPYTGGATTCEAIFMGVPVISLRGKTHGENFSASILTAANLSELIAENFSDYIKKAVELGRNKNLISDYHKNLREKILNSNLTDGRKYLREIEKIYFKICGRCSE